MTGFRVLAVCLVIAGCHDDNQRGSCIGPVHEVATGGGDVTSGELTAGAQQQHVTISPDRSRMEYVFVRDGVTYTAVYALDEAPPPPAIRYVSIRRPPPLAACTDIAARGPSIDAIEVRRRGVLISTGVAPFLSATQCMMGVPTDKASPSLGGAPDGVGVALGGNEYAWTLGEHVALRAGDEIVVTVLDGAHEPFQVFAGADQLAHPMELGTLSGTGTVIVPAR